MTCALCRPSCRKKSSRRCSSNDVVLHQSLLCWSIRTDGVMQCDCTTATSTCQWRRVLTDFRSHQATRCKLLCCHKKGTSPTRRSKISQQTKRRKTKKNSACTIKIHVSISSRMKIVREERVRPLLDLYAPHMFPNLKMG